MAGVAVRSNNRFWKQLPWLRNDMSNQIEINSVDVASFGIPFKCHQKKVNSIIFENKDGEVYIKE